MREVDVDNEFDAGFICGIVVCLLLMYILIDDSEV